ncbi:hypothetical protein [Ciceribacter sp. L1K22]|uniref:hypothetical protein n=1 Tax=Ciceribacter sp. L1K22 TaxID=2820275 RepID=UPI001ABEE59F|nr:hypothetical protein [Ciceribacter sp. L1K22]MBO3760470.1 hypothetical protein [Ciceribacter sp. L1K22]
MNNVHTAIHTLFGAAISVALAYDMKFENIEQVWQPTITLVFGAAVAILSELIREKIACRTSFIYEVLIGFATILLYMAIKIDALGLSSDGVVSFKPDPNSVFLALILAMWMLSIGVSGIMQKEDRN